MNIKGIKCQGRLSGNGHHYGRLLWRSVLKKADQVKIKIVSG